MPTCRICNNADDNQTYIVREMMFGSRDKFEYFLCSQCGCLQIKEVPQNMEKYYPKNYYSFSIIDNAKDVQISYFRMLLRRCRANFILTGKGVVGKIVSMIGSDYFSADWDWFRKSKVKLNDEILEIGCGAGRLLFELQQQGFTKLTGIDPYIEKDIISGHVRIFKKHIEQLSKIYDFIMMHHSFEHMPDPVFVLKETKRLLRPGHGVLIRIPVISPYFWQTYGVDWVGIDAPRHFYLHTIDSMKILAKKSGLQLTDIVFDSTAYDLWASEQYRRDIPLVDKDRSYWMNIKNPAKTIFTERQITDFENKVTELNKIGQGARAGFYLYKPK